MSTSGDQPPVGAVRLCSGLIARALPLRVDAQGFTVIEQVIAMFILIVGLLAVVGAFDSARKLSLLSERETTIAHRAQLEIERLQAVPYSKLAMISAPSSSSEASNPDYYVGGAGATYQWDPTKQETEPLVISGSGVVPAIGTEWREGSLSGSIYDFVTWHTDPLCEAENKSKGEKESACPPSEDYKRLTVVATVTDPGGTPVTPVRVSTLIADPNAAPKGKPVDGKQNPLESPETKCGETHEPCTSGIDSGNAQTLFLHDSPACAPGTCTPTTPSSNHETHPTVASPGPKPDLMDTSSPTATTLYNYSGSTAATEYAGGRVMVPDVECSATPSNENAKDELWVTDPLTTNTVLKGVGGLSFYTQTVDEVEATGTLCLGIYEVPESIANLLSEKPKLIGSTASYTPDGSWPRSLTEVSFIFKFDSSSVTVDSGKRIGLRIWPAASSKSKIAIAYDTTAYPSILQLNTE